MIHPNNSEIKIFDFVHIIKSIRDNWLNLKDYERAFAYPNALIFPNFDDTHKVNIAQFQDVRLLYKNEQTSILKQAYRLTAKTCWPTILERQNVNLALKIFDTSTLTALSIYNSKRTDFESRGHANF